MILVQRLRALFWDIPLGVQISTLFTLVLTGTLLVLGAALYGGLDRFLVENTTARLQQAAAPLVQQAATARKAKAPRDAVPTPSPSPDLEKQAADLVRNLSGPDITVAVLRTDGNVITSTQLLAGRVAPPTPVLSASQLANSSLRSASWVLATAPGARELIVVQPLVFGLPGGRSSEQLLLLQAASLQAADAVLNRLRLFLGLGILAGTLVGIMVGVGLTRAVLQPLRNMATTAEAIAAGNLARRIRLPEGHNEVARLGHAFDHMVEQLVATVESQRRFVADASHELRTPLTSLLGLSELLLIGADRGDTSVLQRTIRMVHSELGRVSRLVTDLLTLSQLDRSAPLLQLPLDARQVLVDVVEQLQPLAEAGHVHLLAETSEVLPLISDPDRLHQIILNLVDNALRYTPSGGHVCLSGVIDPASRMVRLQVQDTGTGIAPADLPHIFDRFYRGDRSRDRATGNSGLGLAITQALVAALHGTITIQSTVGVGTCFTILLPVGAAIRRETA